MRAFLTSESYPEDSLQRPAMSAADLLGPRPLAGVLDVAAGMDGADVGLSTVVVAEVPCLAVVDGAGGHDANGLSTLDDTVAFQYGGPS